LNVAASNDYSVSQISVPFSNRTQGTSSASNTYAISNIAKILCVQVMGLHFRIDKHTAKGE